MRIGRLKLRGWTASLLSCLFTLNAFSQQAFAQSGAPPRELRIVILEGGDALNNVRLRTAREPIVQVEDENHKPVTGAVVFFLSPDNGPSGVFLNGSHSLSVVTDASGQAIARGFRPNSTGGDYSMTVTASYMGVTARTVIRQSNIPAEPPPVKGLTKWLLITAAVGGAVGAGAWAATSRNHTTNAGSATTITAGPGTVGPPR